MEKNKKKLRLLFYRPQADGKWIDNAIAAWTRLWNLNAPENLICSHVEIWIPQDGCIFEAGEDAAGRKIYSGNCYSSTMGQIRSKNTIGSGVRKASAADILKHPQRWYYCEFECSDEKTYEKLIMGMEKDVANNQGYDTKLIWSFFWIRRNSQGDKNKYICSEFCFKHIRKMLINEYCKFPAMLEKIEKLKPSMSPLRGAYALYKMGFNFVWQI